MLSPGASLPAFAQDPRGRGELGAVGAMWLQRVRAGEGFSEPAPGGFSQPRGSQLELGLGFLFFILCRAALHQAFSFLGNRTPPGSCIKNTNDGDT